MFTGIIERQGQVAALQHAAGGARLAVELETELDSPTLGESIAISGVCLTLEAGSTPRRAVFFLSSETLQRTTLGGLKAGAIVNIERALKVGDRLGGHFVHGHVDAVGAITRWEKEGEGWALEISFPPSLAPLIAAKGSIAVDGISLTVVDAGTEKFTVAVIPHTAQQTTLRSAQSGTKVNLEADMLARYVQRALAGAVSATSGVTRELLSNAGFESR